MKPWPGTCSTFTTLGAAACLFVTLILGARILPLFQPGRFGCSHTLDCAHFAGSACSAAGWTPGGSRARISPAVRLAVPEVTRHAVGSKT